MSNCIVMGNHYIVKCYINGSCCLATAYIRKSTAIESYEKRVNSSCYDRVKLILENAVYFDDTALVLRSWSK